MIDPGPDVPGHIRALASSVEGADLVSIVLTHGHADHAGGARALADAIGARVWGPSGLDAIDREIRSGASVETDAGDRVTTRLNQLYSEQEKFVILEVEVPAQQAGTEIELVKVNVSYDNLYTQQNQQLSGRAAAKFSQSQQEVKAAVDTEAYEDAVEQVANEFSREALKARDSGDLQGAKKILQESAAYLGSQAEALSSPRLQEQKDEALQDAAEMDDRQDWNKQRKELKARQYKRATQQTY